MLPVMRFRTMSTMMLLRSSAMMAMAMLASPRFYALRLHSPAKATALLLPHKSIPSSTRDGTPSTCTYVNVSNVKLKFYRIIKWYDMNNEAFFKLEIFCRFDILKQRIHFFYI